MISECRLINKDYQKEIKDVYIGDLLSVVMGNIKENSLWITSQKSMNVIAIASLNDISAIIFVHSIMPDEEVIRKADECEITLYSTDLSAYEIIKKILDR